MKTLKISITKAMPLISGDIHPVPDDLDSFSSEEAFGVGHEAGLEDKNDLMAKITELYDNWDPAEDNETATQYKEELGKLIHPEKSGGCGG